MYFANDFGDIPALRGDIVHSFGCFECLRWSVFEYPCISCCYGSSGMNIWIYLEFFSQRCFFHLQFRNPRETGAPLHLHSLCRENDQLVCMLLRFVWPFWESETSKGRIVHLRSERRRNCRVHWAVANYIHSSPTWHNVRTRDLFVGNYCIFQVRIALFWCKSVSFLI